MGVTVGMIRLHMGSTHNSRSYGSCATHTLPITQSLWVVYLQASILVVLDDCSLIGTIIGLIGLIRLIGLIELISFFSIYYCGHNISCI